MWKLILILILVIYILNKVSFFLFKVMGRTQAPPNFRRPANGSIHVDDSGKKSPKRNGGMKGGDYIDYEEVK